MLRTSKSRILITLTLFLGIIWCLDIWRTTKKYQLLFFGGFLSLFSCFLEGGMYLFPVLLIFYFGYGKLNIQASAIALFCILLLSKAVYTAYVTGSGLFSTLTFSNEWMMIAIIPLLYLYNGQRGRKSRFNKYLFYVIYPIHLWILMIMRFILIGQS